MDDLIKIPSFLSEGLEDAQSLLGDSYATTSSDQYICTKDGSCKLVCQDCSDCSDCSDCADCNDVVVSKPGQGSITGVT